MAVRAEVLRFTPDSRVLDSSFAVPSEIFLGNRRSPHVETADFPQSDPWSRFMVDTIEALREQGAFHELPIFELGVGDGRNIRHAGISIAEVTGIDLEERRLDLAWGNLVEHRLNDVPVEFWQGDAIELLHKWPLLKRGEKIGGWAFVCLPQSTQAGNTADGYDSHASLLAPYKELWDPYGLTLNAAALSKLRAVAAPNLRALVIISDRVPPVVREELVKRTGWIVENEFLTEEPIQQDPDTGVEYVKEFDDGKRFYELRDGIYQPISARVAEERRLHSLSTGQERIGLNVYHHLNIYQLAPAQI